MNFFAKEIGILCVRF